MEFGYNLQYKGSQCGLMCNAVIKIVSMKSQFQDIRLALSNWNKRKLNERNTKINVFVKHVGYDKGHCINYPG